jgi:hypothetical protein
LVCFPIVCRFSSPSLLARQMSDDEVKEQSLSSEKETEFGPQAIAQLLRVPLAAASEEEACGDFASFGCVELPYAGLSIHPSAAASASAGAAASSDARRTAVAGSGGAFHVALPLAHTQAAEQLKAHCSRAPSSRSHKPLKDTVWQVTAEHIILENPAFHSAVSALMSCVLHAL